MRIEDPYFALEWRLRLDPDDWAHTSVNDYAQGILHTIVSGPFHLTDKRDCSAEVSFMIDPATGSKFRPVCRRCEPAEYADRLEDASDIVEAARRGVAGELQRMYRNGERFSKVVKLNAGPSNFLARPRRQTG